MRSLRNGVLRLFGQTPGRVYRYYGCTQKDSLTASDGKKCPGKAVRAEVLEQLIWDTVSGLLSASDTLNNEFQRRRFESTSDNNICDERRKLEAELKRLATQADRFLDLYGDGTFDRDALDQKMEQVNAQRRAAEIDIKALEKRRDDADRSSNASMNLESFCRAV